MIMNPQHDKPLDISPYGSLFYLNHYIGLSGIGIFLVRIGLQESPCRTMSRVPYFGLMSTHLQKSLRDLVKVRATSLDSRLNDSEEQIKDILGKELRLNEGVLNGPNLNYSLGDAVCWILKQEELGPKYFGERVSTSMKERKIHVCNQIGAFTLEDVLPRANQAKPKDPRTQYDYLRGYLPRHFNKKP
jgi:hypothetical protein